MATFMQITKHQLDNGLQVILQESHAAPVASFWLFYRVGSRNEQPGLTGVSHWVEHMLFKGTEQFPRGEFDRAVARAGGFFNGMTSQDWTTYFETFPAERIELALQVESDRMANALFDPDECASERTVILSEREGGENDPFWLLNEEVQATAFHAHSYRHPVIGWKHDLHGIQRDDLYAHYRTYYTPNNAIAVVAGDFDSATMLRRVEMAFGEIAPGPTPPAQRSVEPPQQAERRVTLHGPDPTSYLLTSFPAPAADHTDFFPLIILDSILGGAKGLGLFGGSANNRSNRLYRTLVDTDLAVDVDSSFRPTIDPFLFQISVTPAANVPPQQIEDALWQLIRSVQENGVRQAELQKAIQQTKAQFAYSNESTTARAYWLGVSEIVAGSGWLDGWLDRLSAVTPNDVQHVAQAYLQPARQTIGWYLPEERCI
jgi:zinc protease